MAGKKKEKKAEEAQAGAPLWMVTYGDLMSLLLCFFVLLVSFSTMEKLKYTQAVSSIRRAFSILGKEGEILSFIRKVKTKPYPAPTSNFYRFVRYGRVMQSQTVELSEEQERKEVIAEVSQELMMIIRKMGISDSVAVSYTNRGVKVRIPSKILFDSGSANLKEDALNILGKLSFVFKRLSYLIMIEGHTDNLPITNLKAFKSNWELSAARAISVVKFFIKAGIEPSHLAAAGYGEYQPIADNATKQGRAKNRRVEINIDISKKKQES